MTFTNVAAARNTALIAARVLAGIFGAIQLAGATYFLVVVPSEAVWVGPFLDVPVVAITLTSIALKLAVALLPNLSASRRIRLGLIAVVSGIIVTLVKIPVYDEPEGFSFLAADAVLVGLLLLARRTARRA